MHNIINYCAACIICKNLHFLNLIVPEPNDFFFFIISDMPTINREASQLHEVTKKIILANLIFSNCIFTCVSVFVSCHVLYY